MHLNGFSPCLCASRLGCVTALAGACQQQDVNRNKPNTPRASLKRRIMDVRIGRDGKRDNQFSHVRPAPWQRAVGRCSRPKVRNGHAHGANARLATLRLTVPDVCPGADAGPSALSHDQPVRQRVFVGAAGGGPSLQPHDEDSPGMHRQAGLGHSARTARRRALGRSHMLSDV